MRRSLGLVTLAIAAITLAAGRIYFERIDRFWGITQTDFSVFYDAGDRMVHRESLYTYRSTHYTTNEEYLFKYAPPFALAMMPLARLGVNVAIRWWYALLALALLGALACARALLCARRDGAELPLAVDGLTLLMILRPYLANLRLGQVDVLLACLLLAFLLALARRRDGPAGWCLGAAIVCKLAPALWLLYLAATRRWRALIWTVIAVGVYLASPIPHLGFSGTWHALHEWVGTLQTSGGNWEWLVRYKNQSVLGLILRGFSGGHVEAITRGMVAAALGLTGLAGLVYSWGVWRVLKRHPLTDPSLAGLVAPSLVMIAMVLFSPHAWKATFIHLLLPYAVVIADLVARGRRDRVGWGLLAGSFLLVSGSAPDVLLGRELAHIADLMAPMLWGAVLLAMALWRVQTVRAGR